MKQHISKQILFFIAGIFISSLAAAKSDLACTCLATGPGYEVGVNADKICSYKCDCSAGGAVPILDVKTSARSLESWDIGSQVCHGQFAYRPRLDSPNWQIQVRFTPFQIDNSGLLTYEESTEIANGFRSNVKRTKIAPEILEKLLASLRP